MEVVAMHIRELIIYEVSVGDINCFWVGCLFSSLFENKNVYKIMALVYDFEDFQLYKDADGSYYVERGSERLPAEVQGIMARYPTLKVAILSLNQKGRLIVKEENGRVIFLDSQAPSEQLAQPQQPKLNISGMMKGINSALRNGLGFTISITGAEYAMVDGEITKISDVDWSIEMKAEDLLLKELRLKGNVARKKLQAELEKRMVEHEEKINQDIDYMKIIDEKARRLRALKTDEMKRLLEMDLRYLESKTEHETKLQEQKALSEEAKAVEVLNREIITMEKDREIRAMEMQARLSRLREKNRAEEVKRDIKYKAESSYRR